MNRDPRRLWRALVVAGGFWCAAVAVAAVPARPAQPLPDPTGEVAIVSTEAELQAAVASVRSNATIKVSAGVYQLTRTLQFNGPLAHVTLRGATDTPDDVVLQGPGMTNASFGAAPHGIWTGGNVRNLTIANLTVRDFYQHTVIFNPGTVSPHVHNVRLVNAGQQFIKANPDGEGGGVDNGVVEDAVIEYDTTSKDDYTNGVDVHTGRDWIIRNSTFRNIRAPRGALAGPAILMWNRSAGTTVEGNTFVDCQREIAFGLVDRSPFDHSGGIIRDNVIARDRSIIGDVAIGVFASPDTQVLHNTVRISGTYTNAIEYRFASTRGVVIRNNRVDGQIQAREGASATVADNQFIEAPPQLTAAAALKGRVGYLVAILVVSLIAAIVSVAALVVLSRRPVGRSRHHRSRIHTAHRP